MKDTVALILMILGTAIIGFGLAGMFRFRNFYPRILVASIIDTMGFTAVLSGVILKNGISFFSLKVFMIIVLSMIINPVITHSVTRSAYYSGYKVRKD